ncbi:MAG: biopolymer transporter ExbD [Isosphaeraceae bacterium]
MKTHSKAHREPDEPEVPITPMLDMAFQLLTFFVLTYHPAPVEGQFAMSLLPPQPATAVEATPPPDAAASSDLPASLRTVTTTLHADDTGALGRITLGEQEVNGLDDFKDKAGAVLDNPDLPFDQALIVVDPRLRYEGLMRVVDILSRFTNKIAFQVIEEAGGGQPLMRKVGLFRGSELVRMLVLAGIGLIGWPLACYYGGTPGQAQRRPNTPIAEVPPLPEPDDSVVFAGLHDKSPLNFRDNPALSELLERSRKTTAQALADEARRDVTLRELIARPERYRGLPIHVEGTANRIFRNEVKTPELTRQGHLYEAWVFSKDEPKYPFCLMFETPPDGLPGGTDLHEYVGFDGYFLKLLAYDAEDGARFAPLLIGRLGWTPDPDSIAAKGPDNANLSWLDREIPGLGIRRRHAFLGALLVMMAITMSRIALGWFKPGRGRSKASRKMAPNDAIEPEELSAWLKQESPKPEGGPPANGHGG